MLDIRSVWEKACDKKRRYTNQEAATTVARRLHEYDNSYMIAYPCPFCKGWHVGHAPRHVRKEINATIARNGGQMPADVDWFGFVKIDMPPVPEPKMSALDFFSSRMSKPAHK